MHARDLVPLLREHVIVSADDDDGLLELYADAALRAAERYTGKTLRSLRITQQAIIDANGHVKLERSGALDAQAQILTPAFGWRNMQPVISGRRAMFPPSYYGSTVSIVYRIGPDSDSIDEIDPDIVLGMLVYAAHAYEHRGDSVMSANRAVDSGAIAHWQQQMSLV